MLLVELLFSCNLRGVLRIRAFSLGLQPQPKVALVYMEFIIDLTVLCLLGLHGLDVLRG